MAAVARAGPHRGVKHDEVVAHYARECYEPAKVYSPLARRGVRSSGSASSISFVKISSPRL